MTVQTEPLGPLGDGRRIILRPHRSMSWRQATWVCGLFAGCMVVCSAYWVARGAWVVLPFFGLELAVLALGLYLNAHAGARREVIDIDGPSLRISWGRSGPEGQIVLPRHWTRPVLSTDPSGWYPSRLALVAGGRRVSLAAGLTEEERRGVAAELAQQLGPAPRPPAGSAPSMASHGLSGTPVPVTQSRRI
jgi:uncharacterized membrane protein